MNHKRVGVKFPAAGTDGTKIVALSMGSQDAAVPEVYCSRCTYRWREGLRWDWIPRGKRLRCPNCGGRQVRVVTQPPPPEAA